MADEASDLKPQPPKTGPKRPVIKKRQRRKDRQEELQQPDEFVEVGGTIVDWVVDRGKPIGIGIGVILAGLLVWGVGKSIDKGSRTDAAEALYIASRDLPDQGTRPGVDEPVADPDADAKLEKAVAALAVVSTEHDGTPQGGIAAMEAGSALYRAGRYDDALTRFETAEATGGLVGEMALNGKAYTLESLQRFDEAATAFQTVRTQSTGGAKEQATIDLGRVYEAAGQPDKARSVYEEFEADFPESALLADVQARAAAVASR